MNKKLTLYFYFNILSGNNGNVSIIHSENNLSVTGSNIINPFTCWRAEKEPFESQFNLK